MNMYILLRKISMNNTRQSQQFFAGRIGVSKKNIISSMFLFGIFSLFSFFGTPTAHGNNDSSILSVTLSSPAPGKFAVIDPATLDDAVKIIVTVDPALLDPAVFDVGDCTVNGVDSSGNSQNNSDSTYTIWYSFAPGNSPFNPDWSAGHLPIDCTLQDGLGHSAHFDTWTDGNTLAGDKTVPTVTKAETQDMDGNGKIDAIKLTLSEAIDDGRLNLGTYDNWDVTGYSGESIGTGSVVNDNILLLRFTEGTNSDLGVTPIVTYTTHADGGSMMSTHDLAGNELASGSWTATVSDTTTTTTTTTTTSGTVKDLAAEYRPATKDVKLIWKAKGDAISEVLIYRGTKKHFSKNSNSRLAKQKRNDKTYIDKNVEPGKTYYYEVIARNDAGKEISKSKVVKVVIPNDKLIAVKTKRRMSSKDPLSTETQPVVTAPLQVTPTNNDQMSVPSNAGTQSGEVTDENAPTGNGFPSTVWTWGSVSVLVLVVVALFMRHRRPKKSSVS